MRVERQIHMFVLLTNARKYLNTKIKKKTLCHLINLCKYF